MDMGRYSIVHADCASDFRDSIPPSDLGLSDTLKQHGAAVYPVLWDAPDIDWGRFDCVAIRSCWDYHLRVDEFLDRIGRVERARVTILNCPDLIRWNVNKRYLVELASAGVAIPETVWVEAGEQIDVGQLCEARG
jgi:hypothetical protein